MVWDFFLVLAVKISERDWYHAIDTLLELEGP